MKPYYDAGGVTIYHGDCRQIVTLLPFVYDCIIADPPYSQTSLAWDRWPDGWPDALRENLARYGSMWCFGSLRMLMERADEFARWKFAQDIVWEKHNGSNMHNDRFKRVHEQAAQFYRRGAAWGKVYKSPVMVNEATKRQVIRRRRPNHFGQIGSGAYASELGGPKFARSVIYARSCHGSAENETQKPLSVVQTLVEYSCPPQGLILSPFAGSGTDGVVARLTGRRAVLIEAREEQCEIAAKNCQQTMPLLAKEINA